MRFAAEIGADNVLATVETSCNIDPKSEAVTVWYKKDLSEERGRAGTHSPSGRWTPHVHDGYEGETRRDVVIEAPTYKEALLIAGERYLPGKYYPYDHNHSGLMEILPDGSDDYPMHVDVSPWERWHNEDGTRRCAQQ